MNLPRLYDKKDAYYLAAAVFILVTLPLLLYLVSTPQLIGKKAASPTGTVAALISPEYGEPLLGGEVEIQLAIAPKDGGTTVAISGVSLYVFYEYSEGSPPLTLVGDVQPSNEIVSAGWICPVKRLHNNPGKYAVEVVCVYTSGSGGSHPLSQNLPVASFRLKAENHPQTNNQAVLKFDEERSQAADPSMSKDILYSPLPESRILVVGLGGVSGKVSRQAFTDRRGIMVTIDGDRTTQTSDSGDFIFTDVPYGSHTAFADYPRFLRRVYWHIYVANPSTVDIGETMLLAGDQDDNGAIDIRDLVTVAINFGQTVGLEHQADVNGDGKVNIFDLVAVAVNWRKSEPVDW